MRELDGPSQSHKCIRAGDGKSRIFSYSCVLDVDAVWDGASDETIEPESLEKTSTSTAGAGRSLSNSGPERAVHLSIVLRDSGTQTEEPSIASRKTLTSTAHPLLQDVQSAQRGRTWWMSKRSDLQPDHVVSRVDKEVFSGAAAGQVAEEVHGCLTHLFGFDVAA